MKAVVASPFALVGVAVAYATVANRDLQIGPVPLKFVLTAAALGVWWWRRGRHVETRWLPAILLFAVGVPAFGVAVAVLRTVLDDPAQSLGLRSALEEASRFSYLLLALPIADWMASSRRSDAIWLVPAIGLAVLSWALYVMHQLGVDFPATGSFGPWQGDFGVDPASGWFRAFMVTHVLFVPALVVVFVRLHDDPRRPWELAMTVLLLGAIFLSHGRGVWLGAIVGCGMALTLRLCRERPAWRRALPLVWAVLAVALVVSTAPTIARPVVEAVTGGSTERSSGLRLEQAPELVEGFRDHPVIGSGFGATLPSGYRRSEATPWSYELAYLQLLFQLGIVGLALLAVLPWRVLRTTLGRLWTLEPRAASRATAGASTLIGLLLTFSGNPYLITSAGTLALAVTVALCAHALGSPGGSAAAPASPPSRAGSRWRLPRKR